jgi:hypothetical protein
MMMMMMMMIVITLRWLVNTDREWYEGMMEEGKIYK